MAQDAAVTQPDIDALLAHLAMLRRRLSRWRARLQPVEDELAAAAREYKAALAPLNRRKAALQAEIRELRQRLEKNASAPAALSLPRPATRSAASDQNETAYADPEEVEKDALLEHLVRVLDPMMNEADNDLLADLQGRCKDPAQRLADVLERLPWGPVWTAASPHEALSAQLRRLRGWDAALTAQWQTVRQAIKQLRRDARYALRQQRQRGAPAWQEFLRQAAAQQQERNEQLQAEAEQLRAEWEQLQKT
jgi:predicted RNase H-like nuclease (RuvC/YqgF family)